jgi:dual specificity tyrosine-phosphorylation-regulated kinase 2/3/4
MADDCNLLKTLIIEICKPLVVLSSCEIVHSDLKTENILIKYELGSSAKQFKLTEVKLIDYGSSFEFTNISQFSMATPEYMPP